MGKTLVIVVTKCAVRRVGTIDPILLVMREECVLMAVLTGMKFVITGLYSIHNAVMNIGHRTNLDGDAFIVRNTSPSHMTTIGTGV